MKSFYVLLVGAVLVGSLAVYAKQNGGVGGNTTGNGDEFRSNANPIDASTDPSIVDNKTNDQSATQSQDTKKDQADQDSTSQDKNNTL